MLVLDQSSLYHNRNNLYLWFVNDSVLFIFCVKMKMKFLSYYEKCSYTFRHVDFHFRTYKRDLAILTEWWQQLIAWCELLNVACQIICIRKQQHRYKAYSAGQTVPSTAQIRAEGNNKKCVGKKRFNGSVPHGLRKEHVLRSPPFLNKQRSYFFSYGYL